MSIDYGSVQHYSDRGFGFVSRTLSSGAKVFFHINTIRRKYPQLAEELDDALDENAYEYLAVSFWYDTETTHKGEQVRDIWLQTNELPEAQRAEARAKLERWFSSTQTPLSAVYERITRELFGQEECDQMFSALERRLREKQQAEAQQRRLAQEQWHRTTSGLPAPSTTSARGLQSAPEPLPSVSINARENWWAEQLRVGEAEPLRTSQGQPIIETKVVGVTYEGRQAVVAQLSVGEEVRLRREPTNPYDRNAIRVERLNGQQIGYISRWQAAMWASLLDNHGGTLPATVTELMGGYYLFSSRGVKIRFVLPESGASPSPLIRDFDENWEQ